MDELHRLSAILIERETIDKDQFERLLAGEAEESVFPPEVAEPAIEEPETEKKPKLSPQPRRFRALRCSPRRPIRRPASAPCSSLRVFEPPLPGSTATRFVSSRSFLSTTSRTTPRSRRAPGTSSRRRIQGRTVVGRADGPRGEPRRSRAHARDFDETRIGSRTRCSTTATTWSAASTSIRRETAFHDAHVQSWVRASRAELDLPLREAIAAWRRTGLAVRAAALRAVARLTLAAGDEDNRGEP